MRNETTFIQLGLSATLKLGVHLPKIGVFLTETGSARTIYLKMPLAVNRPVAERSQGSSSH